MKKIIALSVGVLFSLSLFGAEMKAKDIAEESAKQASVEDSILFIQNQLKKITVQSEKRSTYIFLGTLQEQMSRYEEARNSYAAAAAIASGDAEGMVKKTNEQLVLDAVRCALSAGDSATADSYLNSAVRNSKNETVQAYVKLYTQWSALCRASSVEELQEPLEILKAYTKVNSMSSVQPAVYLTLWYVTGSADYSKEIVARFPKSIEAAIVKGDAQLLPTPFWFFVPKSGEAEQGTGSYVIAEEPKKEKAAEVIKTPAAASVQPVKLQLGLFKTKSNAENLAKELNDKNFEAYVSTETRASGTTYYIVLVNENANNTVADKLRSSGYECYVAN